MSKERNLSAKQRLFLDALISEEAMGDLRTAMRLAGYSDNTKDSYCKGTQGRDKVGDRDTASHVCAKGRLCFDVRSR